MPSHAEEHFDAIGNYYHIIDPEGTLSEIERAKKEVEVLMVCRTASQRLFAM